jgi:hypothetical protein
MGSRNFQIALGIFLFLLSVYLASYSGHIHSVDEAYIVAVTANLGKGRLDVNPVAFYQYGFDTVAQIGTVGLSGDVFCKKGIATSFLALPFFWASKLIPGAGAVHSAHLTSGVITAATGSLLFLYLTALGFSNWASLISALTWGIGTIAWPYARWLFTEPAGALALLMSFYGGTLFRRRPSAQSAFLCGLGLGLAIAAIPYSVLSLPFIIANLFLPSSTPEKIKYALLGGLGGMAGPLLGTALYNALRFGHPMDSGYRLGFSDFTNPFPGMIGLLISPARGLVFYMPQVLLTIPGYWLGQHKHRSECPKVLVMLLTYLFFFGSWRIWHGGWSWGPRYLVPVMPLMFLFIAPVWESFPRLHPFWRGMIFLLVGISILIQVVGVAGDYVGTEFILERELGNQPDSWYYRGKTGLFQPRYSPLVVQAQNLRPETLDLGWMADGRPDGRGLAAAVLALVAGSISLGMGLSPRRGTWLLALCGVTLALCALVLVVRATEIRMAEFRGDGRLEALSFIAANREPGDGLISDTGYLYEFILEGYPRLPPTYILPADQAFSTSLLNRALARYSRLWFIGGYVLPGDPNRWTERWLAQNAFPLQTQDFAFHHLSLFSTPGEVLEERDLNAALGDTIRLKSFRLSYRRGQSDVLLQLTLYWEALRPLEKDYQVFVHAYDSALNLLAQADHSPVNGLRPTSSWLPGEQIEDRVAFRLPEGEFAGFALAVGMYDWNNPIERLPVEMPGNLASGDGRVWLILPGEQE